MSVLSQFVSNYPNDHNETLASSLPLKSNINISHKWHNIFFELFY